MKQTYRAVVKYPMKDEPYDPGKGYGPSFNVAMYILNALDEVDEEAPKSKEGLVNVYKKAGVPEIEYMKTLKENDVVTVIYETRGDSGWYDFVIPPGWQAEVKPANAPTQKTVKAVAKKENVYVPLSDEEKKAYQAKIMDDIEIIAFAVDNLRKTLNALEFNVSDDAVLPTANGLRIGAERSFSRGQKLQAPASVSDAKVARSDMLDGRLDGTIDTALNGIVQLAPAEYDIGQLRSDMNRLGIPKEMFDNNSDILFIARTIWDMLERVSAGMDRDAAISSARDIIEKNAIPW